MLEVKNNENFTGTSSINGVTAERYTATINQQDPTKITFTRLILNQQLRKDNREQCRADMAEFEDDVYAVQDAMIAQDAKMEDVTEAESTEESAGEAASETEQENGGEDA